MVQIGSALTERKKMDKQKVEFIESYIKIGNGDYQWNDNHGELIRCKDCKYGTSYSSGKMFGCVTINGLHEADWFCADGERRTE